MTAGKKLKAQNRRLFVLNLVLAAFAVLFLYTLLPEFVWWMKLVALIMAIVAIILELVLLLWKQAALFRLTQTFVLTVIVLFYAFVLINQLGVYAMIRDPDVLRGWIKSTGIWGPLIYVLLQILQIVVLPIPSIILDLVGVALFGSVKAFFLILIGLTTGSMISFTLGKLFGKKLAEWVCGKEDAEKYRKLIGKRGYFLLGIMFLFPFFPDDVLCVVAGLTAISFGKFFLLMILTRPVSLAFICFFGTGEIIPFSGWGLAFWIILFAALIAAFILFNIFQKQISAFFKKFTGKFTRKKRKKKAKTPA